ncbi:MAG: site-specific DNA-methyltransferase, partial [Pseudomonadota bacterium]
MADDTANNAKKEKFIDLLHELFQLNQPELDFGLYRIMHAKSGQIKAFIENDLAREIDEAFAACGDDKMTDLKAVYEQARAQAKEFGIDDPDANPKVKEAKEAYDAAREGGDDPSDIYDHLYRFFSRYYDKGDFLSRRYHVAENDSRAAPYAVPYDGREVYLHWANKDQYYIKSSEYLSNFSFDLAEALKKERQRQGAAGQGGFDFEAENAQPLKVTFQLVEAAEGAHNNVRENQSRFFIIHAENPVEFLPSPSGRGAGGEGETQELIINFEYRPDPEKSGQDGTWQKKRLQEAEAVILDALKKNEQTNAFHEALAFLAPTEKQRERTLLGKYLTSYTARNTMDYFIHKDLGGFLRRELDFYIKNEIMRLDDLSAEDVAGVTRSLKKITALRTIARQIISFLAQLEEFQKKLWLKKKFVTEVNYCITLDRVPEAFYEEIVANERQWAQWEELGFITKDTARTK